MIRALATLSAATLAAVALPSAAQADVLEIGAAGQARWITGPRSEETDADPVSPTTLAASWQEAPAEAGRVPEHAVATVALSARAVPATYAAKVAELSDRFDLSPALIEALVWQESRWRSDAVSPVGARGLAQLMPGTARELGVDPADPFANLEGGARYLRAQLDRFDGDLERALAAYNAGPGRVLRAGGIPRIRETQTYVAAVMGRLSNHSRSPE
jgi:soluble lytic murein transglycosylase-like protein